MIHLFCTKMSAIIEMSDKDIISFIRHRATATSKQILIQWWKSDICKVDSYNPMYSMWIHLHCLMLSRLWNIIFVRVVEVFLMGFFLHTPPQCIQKWYARPHSFEWFHILYHLQRGQWISFRFHRMRCAGIVFVYHIMNGLLRCRNMTLDGLWCDPSIV